MTYYIADDLEKLDTDSIKLVEIDELNLKKMRYAFDMKYYQIDKNKYILNFIINDKRQDFCKYIIIYYSLIR